MNRGGCARISRRMEGDLEPPGIVLPRRKAAAEPADNHPLLMPLAQAQDAVARLEASASPAIIEGLRARMAYREAAGWLAHGTPGFIRGIWPYAMPV